MVTIRLLGDALASALRVLGQVHCLKATKKSVSSPERRQMRNLSEKSLLSTTSTSRLTVSTLVGWQERRGWEQQPPPVIGEYESRDPETGL